MFFVFTHTVYHYKTKILVTVCFENCVQAFELEFVIFELALRHKAAQYSWKSE